jgi:uncharacterized protein with von Willebrand factor type A (vWA) domain
LSFCVCLSGGLDKNMEELRTDLEIATQQRSAPEGDSLIEALGRLDAVAGQGNLPKQLQHYLERRSYLKALAWLENPDQAHQP